jgi:hypothetical protein
MYIDGHERDDIGEYRCGFISCWKQYESHFHKWDHDGNEFLWPDGLPVPGVIGPSRLILITHDKSTFYQNDQCTTIWVHKSDKATPKPKGDGQSLMVSDFLTPDWGHLCDGNK